jgi:hypothetical protein
MARLTKAGFKKDFVRRAILPEWWTDEAGDDPSLLGDVEFRVARFLGASISSIQAPKEPLPVPAYPSAQLRRVRAVERDRLAPSIHVAVRIAAAVARNLRERADGIRTRPLPSTGLEWRALLSPDGKSPSLAQIASDLWARGIPVVPLDTLPGPTFQGLACIANGHPVILVGHKHDEPGRVAFLLAHEAGHVAAGDCSEGVPVVDGDDDIADESPIELLAERYAMDVMVGGSDAPRIVADDSVGFKELATRAIEIERETGADASTVVFGWARATLNYATATMAVKAMYRATGARRELRKLFERHVDLNGATESDLDLLRCVHGVAPLDEAAD